ncbi:hypothetical protein IHE49_17620 [Rhodanobacter sp. 7MK24]|uniref:hypothetical protein n=1 Tax=Rhodanobacter sp. 7MK24 TaxID=2775922 RepID=UPI00178429FB|nr:hypothetical protein [Rhodanobacter sp. 7MK24]MBD8882305.1 hypothetical protein [Rhodanobacter sp. 7MK24]
MTAFRRYASRLVGDRIEALPGQSPFGYVARLARLNLLSSGDFHGVLGLRVHRSVNLLEHLVLSRRCQEALAEALNFEIPKTWNPIAWHPFTGGMPTIGLEVFRYCIGCIRVGYHCGLHQMPWLSSCPWHGVRLRHGCPRCGGVIAVSGDAGRKLLTCVCGFDLLNETATARLNAAPANAEKAVSAYLNWAEPLRRNRWLAGPPDTPITHEAAAALIQPPKFFAAATDPPDRISIHRRQYRQAPPRQALLDDAQLLGGLSGDFPKLLELPAFLIKGTQAVARDVAAKLPAGSLTEREQLLFLGTPEADLSSFEAADRSSSGTIGYLPPLLVGPRRFLELSSIHPIVIRMIAKLQTAPCFARATGTDHVQANSMRLRVEGGLLCRGYAEGIRTVLSRYVPSLYTMKRDRPRLTAAWCLIETESPYTVWTAFTPINRQEAASDTLIQARPYRR